MSGRQWETHAAKVVAEANKALKQLASAERESEQAKARKNKARQQEADKKVRDQCGTLAQEEPHTFRAYLEAIASPSANVLRKEWQERKLEQAQVDDGLDWLKRLDLEPLVRHSLAMLPPYSLAIELRIKLARPYLSRDDTALYVIDNPVRKDKVFKVPMVSASSWKGSLRSVATRSLLKAFRALLADRPPADDAEQETLLNSLWAHRAQRVLLFGDEKESQGRAINRWLWRRLFVSPLGESQEELQKRRQVETQRLQDSFAQHLIANQYRTESMESRQGRLTCFATYFDRIGLEVINPHDRSTRVGQNPILLESAPAGATGVFHLLYVPYDFPGELTADEPVLGRQAQVDWPLVVETVHDLLTLYGFGAKTSSGFGTAEPGFAATADGKHGGALWAKDGAGRVYGFRVKGFAGLAKALGELQAQLEVGHD